MIDYDKIYIEIVQKLGEEFDNLDIGEIALISEAITQIVKSNVESDISNFQEKTE